MKKRIFISALAITLVNLIVSFVIIYQIREDTNHFKNERNEIARMLNFNERLLDVKEAIPLFGDWVWDNKKDRYEDEVRLANQSYSDAKDNVWWLILVNLIYGVVLITLFLKREKHFTFTLIFTTYAAVALTGGVFTPMLELEAFKENLEIKVEIDAKEMMQDLQSGINKIPFIGSTLDEYIEELLPSIDGDKYKWHKVYPDKMYFFYENKGIFDVLKTLWKTDNIPIAIIVGVFSFIVPTIKLFFSYIILFSPLRNVNRLKLFVDKITKFSMVDVFVIALFITYFTFDELSSGVDTQSNALMGVYFFTCYVLLAIISNYTLERFIDRKFKVQG